MPGRQRDKHKAERHRRRTTTKMIVRPRQSSLSPVAVLVSAALLLTTSPDVSGAPVVVTDYKQLVGTIGSNNDYDTGERFAR